MTTLSEDMSLSLFDVSTKLGVSPSAIKKRVAHLNIPVKRGARGKLIFDRAAYALLAQADEMLKAGHGFDECRRALGLESPVFVPDVTPGEGPELVAVVPQVLVEEPVTEAVEAVVAPEVEPPVVEEIVPEPVAAVAPEPVVAPTPAPVRPVAEVTVPREHPVPQPVVIQLAKRKQAAAAAAAADPETMNRLDAALKILEEKEKQNQMLQSKLLVAYDEMTKLSATAAAFQERSLNLQHEVSKLQGELRLLAAPQANKPWWKFWG